MWGALITTFLVTTAAIPIESNVIHEKKQLFASPRYLKAGRVDGAAIVPVRIGLTQSNLEHGYDHLMDISHPSSPNYGRHWTSEHVEREFGPSSDSVNAVLDWLATSDVQDARQTKNKGWIALDIPAAHFERLFDAELHEYHGPNGSIQIGCDEYSVPISLVPHIDYITPGVKFSPPLAKSAMKRDKSHWGSGSHHLPQWEPPLPPPHPPHWGQWHPPSGTKQLPPELRACGMNITPPCIRALYDIPFPRSNIARGILGIYEFNDQYSQENLDQYFDTYAAYVPQGTHPDLISINNATAPTSRLEEANGGESDLDFDIAYSLLGNVPITLYQVQLPIGASWVESGSQIIDPMLAALDGSYCDEADEKTGSQCGGAALTTILSISYGLPEFLSSYKALQRVCTELMKLSLQGHTIVVSSGDYGVADNPRNTSPTGSVCDSNGCLPRSATDDFTANNSIFNPNFPQSCPYVLSVGATQLNSNDTVRDPESVMFRPEGGVQRVCELRTAFFGSGGGFSNHFSQPSYQKAAVSRYFALHDPGYPYYELHGAQSASLEAYPGDGIYNRAGRASPDVSANGANLDCFVQNLLTQEAGTSLAAPIWAAILAQINQDRKDAGKGPVGFVNPVLYANPGIFNDITNGTNPGCGTDGFAAVEGWDPATGLGTPNYPALAKVFMELP